MSAKIKIPKSKLKMTNQISNCQSESAEGGRRFSNLKFLILLFVFCCLLFVGSCRDKPTPPDVDDKPKPGKRNYIWSIDSVYYGSQPSKIQIEQMWGSSAVDIWGVAGDAPDVRDCLWHYNGSSWTRATAGTPITEFTGNKTLYAIWGSAQNDVWAFGRKINQSVLSAFIMHFDGSKWTDATPSNVASLSTILYNVYGVSKDNIWVGGYEYALHYNGHNWQGYKIADSLTINGVSGIANAVFFQLASPWGKRDNYIYRFKYIESTFKIIDYTTSDQEKFGGKPWIVGSTLYTLTNGIISTTINDAGEIDTTGWTRIFNTSSYLTQLYVVSEKDIFTVGQYNLLYHYNGTDWKQIFISVPNHTVDPQGWFWGLWADGKEVFICDWENGIVYHGR